MLKLFTYKTPPKFADEFKDSYSTANIKQIKMLSTILFIITFSSRILGFIFHKEVMTVAGFEEHAIANWIHLSGAFIFYNLSDYALSTANWSQKNKRILTFAFILFILLITFGVSYVISMHNTKNTLLMFLIGIVTVSLFFAIEYREILMASIFIVIVFVLSMVLPKITFGEKITNVIAAFILGFILLCFSRYSYYFKSKYFVRVKQLEEKNLEIEHLNRQKDEILGFVAHDLRNPLNNIEGLSSLLLHENPESSEAEMIAIAAKQAKTIIYDLIEAVKADQPDLKTVKQELSFYVNNIVERWRVNSKREIIFNHTENAINVALNISKLERVIDNLISNGLKFSEAHTPLTINLSTSNNQALISIKDEGIGIPAKLQQFVFNQFTKAGRRGLQGEKSIGLGLHISKTIIEQHNGQLLMESVEHEGTVFTILLPLIELASYPPDYLQKDSEKN